MSKQCSKCGTVLPEGGSFCPSCGTAVSAAPEAAVEAPPVTQPEAAPPPAAAVTTPPASAPEAQTAAAGLVAPQPEPEQQAAPAPSEQPVPETPSSGPPTPQIQSLWAPPPGAFKLHPPKVEMPKTLELPKLKALVGSGQAAAPTTGTSAPVPGQSAAPGGAPSGATPTAPTLGSAPAISAASPKSLRNAGIGALVVMLLAGIFFFRGGDDPEPVSPPQNGQAQQDPEPVAPVEPVEPVNNGGDLPLESFIVQQVGGSAFNGVVDNPTLEQLTGALDAITVEYVFNDGTPLRGQIAAFASATEGDAGVQAIANIVTINEGHQRTDEFTITGADNLPLGTGVQLIGADEVFIWNYADIVYTIRGPVGYAVDYFNNFLAGT